MKKRKAGNLIRVGKERIKGRRNLWIFLATVIPLAVVGLVLGLVFAFSEPSKYEITVTQSTHGSIMTNREEEKFTQGASVIYIITPETGYEIDSITVDEESIVVTAGPGASQSYVFENITADHTITASFKARTYAITYVLNNGGSVANPTTYTIESQTITLLNPTKTGNTFAGWYTTSNFAETAVTTIETGSYGNKTFYAKWTVNQYTITFETNEGSPVSPITKDYGTAVTAPTVPTKEGYTFAGWYLDNNTFNNQYAFTTIPAEDITVYVRWTINTFNAKFYDNTGAQIGETQVIEHGEDATPPTAPAITGYTFSHWSLTQGGEEVFDNFANVTEDITVYAVYTANTYSVVFNKNSDDAEGTMDNQPFTYDKTETLTANAFTYTGKIFAGWATIPTGLVVYEDEAEVSNLAETGNVTLYAVWEIQEFSVTFHDHNGNQIGETQTVAYGESATAPDDPSNYNKTAGTTTYIYTFNAWNKPFNNVTSDLEVYATYTLYDVNVLSGTTVTIPSDMDNIAPGTFSGLDITDIEVDEDNENYSSQDGLLYDKDQEILIAVPTGKTGSIELPTTLIIIGERAFENSNLLEVILPSTVTEIGDSAFSGSSIQSLSTSSDDTSSALLDGNALAGMTNLTEIIVLENLSDSYPLPTLGSEIYGWYLDGEPPVATTTLSGQGTYMIMYAEGSGTATGGWEYTVSAGQCYITGVPTGTGSLTIPATITVSGESMSVYGLGRGSLLNNVSSYSNITIANGVTNIGRSAFWYCRNLTSITIPDGVTSIGNGAFSGCSNLTSIVIPDRVTSIGKDAFSDCSKLTSITIPNSVTSIGFSAFRNCSSLTSITIPDSVTSIGESAFHDCSKLTSITIPNSVTSIGYSAFSGCSSLTSITIPDGVTSIGQDAFENTAWYSSKPNGMVYAGKVAYKYKGHMEVGTSLTLLEETLVIADYAFSGCSKLTSITIPNSVTSIGDSAFYYCTSLASVTIGNSVESIENFAFSGCSKLTSITIPDSVTSIGGAAFSGCSSLTSIYVESGNINFVSNNNKALLKKIGTNEFELIKYAQGNTATSYIVPNSVTSIGGGAFDGCSSLTSITIPNSVTSIGEYAFYDCSSLTSITIPNSVTSIRRNAFYNCRNLTSITIPNSVITIGNFAFASCTNLTSITIPDSVTSIENYAFYNCTNLTSITIPDSVTIIGQNAFENTPWYNNQPDGLVYAGKVAYAYKGERQYLTSLTLLEGTLGIVDYAFYNCTNLASVVIPDSVVSIGDYAFASCTSLTSITIPNSVTSVGDYAFHDCSSLTSIIIPDSVTSIGQHPFYGTAWYYNQPDGLVYAGKVAYKYKGTMEEGTSLILEAGTLGIAAYAFFGRSGLTSITIPDSVTNIGGHAFRYCRSLTSITIPDSVTNIGDSAFFGCESLTSIEIPNSVESIENYAFYDCDNLTSITIRSTSVVGYGEMLRNTGITATKGAIYVPSGLVNAYKAAEGWFQFADRIFPIVP